MDYQTETTEKIKEIMTENTGAHFLDSGSAHGRHWERNQSKPPEERPTVQLDILDHDPVTPAEIISVNTFYFLNSVLEYGPWAEKNTRWFHEWCEEHDLPPQLEAMREYTQLRGINTFNFDPPGGLLDQVLQFCMYEPLYGFEHGTLQEEDKCRVDTDRPWVLLQIHNGCDVRGGYTDAVFFKPAPYRDLSDLIRMMDVLMLCTECGLSWYTDDAHHVYNDHGDFDPELSEKYEQLSIVDRPDPDPDVYDWEDIIMDEENNKMICPFCYEEITVHAAGVSNETENLAGVR